MSILHSQAQGTTGGCTSALCRHRRRKMTRVLMSPWPPRMLGRRHQPSPGCHHCIPPLPQLVSMFELSLHFLSPLSPWKRLKAAEGVFGAWDPPKQGAPSMKPGLLEQGSRSLEKGREAKPWLRGVRPLCNGTEDNSAAKFQATWSSLQISQILAKFNKPVHKLKVK